MSCESNVGGLSYMSWESNVGGLLYLSCESSCCKKMQALVITDF